MITFVAQPLGKPLCGQTCLAMLLGMTVDQVVAEMGWAKGTKTKQLAAYLRKKGWASSTRLKRLVGKASNLPAVAICKFGRRHVNGKILGNWHWVLWAEGRFWDGAHPGYKTINQMLSGLGRKNGQSVCLSSYLPITKDVGKGGIEVNLSSLREQCRT